jgi:hypothetical protein
MTDILTWLELMEDLEEDSQEKTSEALGFLRSRLSEQLRGNTLPQRGIGTFALRADSDPEEDVDEEPDEDGSALIPGSFDFSPKSLRLERDEEVTDEDELIRRYQNDPTPANLEAVMATPENQKFLNWQIRSHSSMRIPYPAIQGAVYNTFADAVMKHDIGRANIRTAYKGSQGRNLKRDFRQAAQFGKAGRDRVPKMEEIRIFQENYEIENEREASPEEVAEGLRIPLKTVELTLKETAGDMLQSREMNDASFEDTGARMMRAAHRIRDYYTGPNQLILDYFFGINGKEMSRDNKVVAKAVGVSPTHVSAQKKRIAEDLQRELQIMGM